VPKTHPNLKLECKILVSKEKIEPLIVNSTMLYTQRQNYWQFGLFNNLYNDHIAHYELNLEIAEFITLITVFYKLTLSNVHSISEYR